MLRTVAAFVIGVSVGAAAVAAGQGRGSRPPETSVAQLRLYTIDRGRLDDWTGSQPVPR